MKIITPLGWEAGQPLEAADVVKNIAIEMLAHRSDLQEITIRRAKDDQERAAITERAELLEKYAVALYAAAVQMNPAGYQVESMAGLLELAAKHNITLPDWMKTGGQPDNV